MVVPEAVDRECALAFHRRVNEPPKIKWKVSLILISLSMIIIFIGVAVSAGDVKKFGYFAQAGGAGIVFGFVKFGFDNWKRMVWEDEHSDDDDDDDDDDE